MKITILDMDAIGRDMDLTPLEALGELTVYGQTAPEEVAERIEDCDAVLLNKVKLTRETAGNPRHLGLIAEAATGYDNIDLAFCREKGIAVTNVAGYSTDCVTQITVSLALSLISRMPTYTNYVSGGAYTENGRPNLLTPAFHEIAGKTWGILGLGHIGKSVARVATALGCRVIGVRRSQDSEFQTVSLETLLKESDILSIHLPLTDETRGIIGENELKLMKKDAILINVARGAVIDEKAVTEALLSGALGGLGIDVYSTEPFPKNHPYTKLLRCEKAVLTPHMAWAGYETRARLLGEMTENIKAWLRGEMRNRIV